MEKLFKQVSWQWGALLLVSATACTRPLASKQKHSPYELTRFHRRSKSAMPCLTGQIRMSMQPGQLPSLHYVLLAVDKVVTRPDTSGQYYREVSIGKHTVSAGFLAYIPIQLKEVRFRAGDSIQLNMYLQADTTGSDENFLPRWKPRKKRR